MNMPDITPAQIVSVVGSLIAVLVSFGVQLTPNQQKAVIDLVTIVAPVLLVSDAVIRHGRSKIAAQVQKDAAYADLVSSAPSTSENA